MLFTSYNFIGFLMVVFALYYLLPRRFQWMLLLAASYVFYFCAGAVYPLYLTATVVTTWLAGKKLGALNEEQKRYIKENRDALSREDKKAYKAGVRSRKMRWFLLCLLLNFGILAVLKYSNFAIANVNAFLGEGHKLSFLKLALPLGISFYTFQSMGYLIDVFREKYDPEKSVFRFALFVSFFPQLIQGPISRFDDLAATLYEKHGWDAKNISFGLQRILWGYFKKAVIADRVLIAVNTIIRGPEEYQGAYVLVGMVFYGLELYADFTGGIDITIGIAELFGIRLQENFIRPYFSKSIAEYWRRWHISMGTWFRDYVFYPISISGPMQSLSKSLKKRLGAGWGKRLPVYIATVVTWFATGIWHGASWNFIMWGLMNSVVIMISQELEPLYAAFHRRLPGLSRSVAYQAFQVIRTFFLMSSLRLFDCYRDVRTAFAMFGNLFTHFNPKIFADGSLLGLGLGWADYAVLLAGALLLFSVSLLQRRRGVRERLAARPLAFKYALNCGLLLAVLILGVYGIGYDSAQFIYNQF